MPVIRNQPHGKGCGNSDRNYYYYVTNGYLPGFSGSCFFVHRCANTCVSKGRKFKHPCISQSNRNTLILCFYGLFLMYSRIFSNRRPGSGAYRNNSIILVKILMQAIFSNVIYSQVQHLETANRPLCVKDDMRLQQHDSPAWPDKMNTSRNMRCRFVPCS